MSGLCVCVCVCAWMCTCTLSGLVGVGGAQICVFCMYVCVCVIFTNLSAVIDSESDSRNSVLPCVTATLICSQQAILTSEPWQEMEAFFLLETSTTRKQEIQLGTLRLTVFVSFLAS